MPMNIENVTLLDLQTSKMKQDPTVQGFCAALEPQFRQIAQESKACAIYSRLDQLDSIAIDELAWQMDVDYYDANLEIDIKRQLVKNSLRWHKIKGTPAAVEELITLLFGEGKVVEWFEYGGDPGYFKVITNNPEVTQEKAEEFIEALNSVKRLSAWLEKVELSQVETMNLYFAGILHMGDKLEIRQVV